MTDQEKRRNLAVAFAVATFADEIAEKCRLAEGPASQFRAALEVLVARYRDLPQSLFQEEATESATNTGRTWEYQDDLEGLLQLLAALRQREHVSQKYAQLGCPCFSCQERRQRARKALEDSRM